jgi:hypothetical protein
MMNGFEFDLIMCAIAAIVALAILAVMIWQDARKPLTKEKPWLPEDRREPYHYGSYGKWL